MDHYFRKALYGIRRIEGRWGDGKQVLDYVHLQEEGGSALIIQGNIIQILILYKLVCNCSSTQALKVLRTSEFMPYVVFIAAPELDTLRAMHKAVVDAGITTKLLTVRSFFQASSIIFLLKFFVFLLGMFNSIYSYL